MTPRYDFKIRYRFLTAEEGGRRTGPPSQGYRCDFAYEEDDIAEVEIYMIWPTFEDSNAQILPRGERVAEAGIALMTILNEELRETLHKRRIAPGVKGWLMEGSKRVAELEVTALLALATEEK